MTDDDPSSTAHPPENAVEREGAAPTREGAADDVDRVLDAIEEELETNSEDFVRGFVQKGGQGWSALLDPAFFIGSVSAGVAAAITWDAFKATISKVITLLRHVPGPSNADAAVSAAGTLTPEYEEMLHDEWMIAKEILSGGRPARHSLDEANSFHWVLFFRELMRSNNLVRLRPEHYTKLAKAGNASPESLDPSQLTAHIIDEWLRKNPNAELGIYRGR